MAQPYFEGLSQIIDELGPPPTKGVTIEIKHFFSGAALYANGKICATLSPAGFAIKLPPGRRLNLIDERQGEQFRFFAKGPIKREYVALSDSIIRDRETLRGLIAESMHFASGTVINSQA